MSEPLILPVLLFLLALGFVAGYGMRSYMSYRRRKRVWRHSMTDEPNVTFSESLLLLETRQWMSAKVRWLRSKFAKGDTRRLR